MDIDTLPLSYIPIVDLLLNYKYYITEEERTLLRLVAVEVGVLSVPLTLFASNVCIESTVCLFVCDRLRGVALSLHKKFSFRSASFPLLPGLSVRLVSLFFWYFKNLRILSRVKLLFRAALSFITNFVLYFRSPKFFLLYSYQLQKRETKRNGLFNTM